eukprot:TRINITY_DN11384_c0_g1_i1.p1 TRINITY_DN11384_c0_g1~~TRINITY_DN11384_c0_g1_i1.p1  ORF type:complete len:220 (-),score=50.44 TRINITY_DN11384_c0_g1_i1:36-695(-)
MLFKELGAKWTAIAKKFRNRNENQVKNRFYSTLRRVATKICSERGDQVPQKKEDLIRFVDEAFEFGHECKSKRCRKRKETEEENPGILASKPSPSLLDREERAKSEFSLKKKYQFKDLGGKKDFAAQALPPIASLLPTVPHYPTDDKYRIVQKIPFLFSRQPFVSVSYTHLTLPTILLVQISVVAGALKKKKKDKKTESKGPQKEQIQKQKKTKRKTKQ